MTSFLRKLHKVLDSHFGTKCQLSEPIKDFDDTPVLYDTDTDWSTSIAKRTKIVRVDVVNSYKNSDDDTETFETTNKARLDVLAALKVVASKERGIVIGNSFTLMTKDELSTLITGALFHPTKQATLQKEIDIRENSTIPIIKDSDKLFNQVIPLKGPLAKLKIRITITISSEGVTITIRW